MSAPINRLFARGPNPVKSYKPLNARFYSDLNRGQRGQKVFPRGTLLKNFKRDIPTAIAFLAVFNAYILAWPIMFGRVSNFIHGVPAQTPRDQAA